MKSALMIFIGVFSLIYGGASYYVGSRFLDSMRDLRYLSPLAFWLVFALFSWSPFLARIGSSNGAAKVPQSLIRLGDYWMAALYYLFLGWLAVDVLRLLTSLLRFPQAGLLAPTPILALSLVAVLLLVLMWGTVNSRSTRISRYEIPLPGTGENETRIRAVMVSDVHLGRTIGLERLKEMVDKINSLEPDVVFMPGDIIDGDVSYYEAMSMDKVLAGIKAPRGKYASLGNHEYLGGSGEAAVEQLERAGITVLRDRCVTVPGLFNVAGRDDRMSSRLTGSSRRPLDEVLSTRDPSLPTVLLDHQPYDLHEASGLGVELQLSGHTHYGQFFPNNLITGRIFEQDWGYLMKDNTHIVVSCGYGTWGPPIRVGSHSEIVVLNIVIG